MTNADLVYQNGPWKPTPRDVLARRTFIKRTKDGTPNIGNTVIKIPIHSYNPPSIGRLPPSAWGTASITHRSLAYGTKGKPQSGRKSLKRLKSKTRPEDDYPDAMDMINEYNSRPADTAMENMESPKSAQPSPVIKSRSPVKFSSLDIEGNLEMIGPDETREDTKAYRTPLTIITNPDKAISPDTIDGSPSKHNIGDLADAYANLSPGAQKTSAGLNEITTTLDNLGGHLPGHPRTAQKPNEVNTAPLSATINSASSSGSTHSEQLQQIGVLTKQINDLIQEQTQLKGEKTKKSINRKRVVDNEIKRLVGQKKTIKIRMKAK